MMDIFLVAPYDKYKVALHYGHCIAHYLSTCLDVGRILIDLNNGHISSKHKVALHYGHCETLIILLSQGTTYIVLAINHSQGKSVKNDHGHE